MAKKAAKKKASSKGKTYTKTHQTAKAAKGHIRNIKKRGGKAEEFSVKGKKVVTYSFPNSK